MNANNITNKVLFSKDLFELANNLEQFITYANDNPNKELEYFMLHQKMKGRIYDYSSGKAKAPYVIYNEQESVLVYLANYWDIQMTCEKNIEIFSNVIEEIRTKLLAPNKTMISEDTIVTLLNYVDSVFSLYANVLNGRPLKILRLNHSHVEWNSFYSASIYVSGKIDDCIMMTHMNDTRFKSEFSFLHEVGHIIHTRLTGKLHTPPESFRLLHKILLSEELDSVPEGADERFANFFAIATLYNSPFAYCDPYEGIPPKEKERLLIYMYRLLQGEETEMVRVLEEILAEES